MRRWGPPAWQQHPGGACGGRGGRLPAKQAKEGKRAGMLRSLLVQLCGCLWPIPGAAHVRARPCAWVQHWQTLQHVALHPGPACPTGAAHLRADRRDGAAGAAGPGMAHRIGAGGHPQRRGCSGCRRPQPRRTVRAALAADACLPACHCRKPSPAPGNVQIKTEDALPLVRYACSQRVVPVPTTKLNTRRWACSARAHRGQVLLARGCSSGAYP